jgi:hypothetical protein
MQHPLALAALLLAACTPPAPAPIVRLPELAPPPAHAVLASAAPLPAPAAPPPASPSATAEALSKRVTCFDVSDRDRHEPIEAAWAPVRSRMAITCASGIEVVDLPARTLVGRRPTSFTRGPFRSDGGALVLASSKETVIWDLASDTLTPLPGLPAGASPERVAPGFDRAVISDAAGALAVVDLISGATLARLGSAQKLGGAEVSWSPDGATVATAAGDLVLWDAATGKLLHTFASRPGERLDEDSLRWTGNGATLFFRASIDASMDGEGRIRALTVKTGAVSAPFSGSAFAVARDGRALFTSEPGLLRRIDLASGARRTLYRDESEGWHYLYGSLGVSADGRWLTGTMSMMSGMDFAAFAASDGKPAPWR